MRKQKNTEINAIKYYDDLKDLVEQKYNLDKENKRNSDEYLKISDEIQELMEHLSEKDLNNLMVFCKREYKSLVNMYNIDMSPSILSHISSKININDICYNVIDANLNLKKDAEYNR